MEAVLCITCQGIMLLVCCVCFSLNYFSCLNCLDAIEVCKNGNTVYRRRLEGLCWSLYESYWTALLLTSKDVIGIVRLGGYASHNTLDYCIGGMHLTIH